MKKSIISFVVLTILNFSCNSFRNLSSTTYIKANQSFVLGNNEHGTFKASMKNVSSNNLEVYQAPIAGGKHSIVIVKPNESVNVKIDSNTALIINNRFDTQATVKLMVKGDTGLSMGYKN
jgi:hypothetical protein